MYIYALRGSPHDDAICSVVRRALYITRRFYVIHKGISRASVLATTRAGHANSVEVIT